MSGPLAADRELADAMPQLVWTAGADGVVDYYNRRIADYDPAVRLPGGGFDWRALVHPEDFDATLAAWQAAQASGVDFAFEHRLRMADGAWRWHLSRAVPAPPNRAGRVARWYGTATDIHGLKTAERSFAEQVAQLEAVYRAAPLGLCLLDRDLRFVRINEALAEMNGLPASAHIGRRLQDVLPTLRRALEPLIRRVLATGEPAYGLEIAGDTPKAPGLVRHWLEQFYPIRDGDGGVSHVGVVCEEVTERKRAEERQALLMREVDHRARNALAVVQAIVRLTRADDSAGFVAAVEGRIGAVAHAHTLLAESGWASASLARLFERERAGYGAERVRLSGDDVVLGPEVAQPFALAVHELFTNAAKHGALSRASGRVDVAWRADGAGREGLRIAWRETGGPPVRALARRGFGTSLVALLLEGQVGGSFRPDWRADGLACEIVVPLARLSRASSPHGPAKQEP